MGSFAFRCRNCGRLTEPEHAGDNHAVPLACRSCGKGVHFIINEAGNPQQVRDPENWLVLADLAPDELQEILEYHGISADEVVRHTPGVGPEPVSETPQMVEVSASEDMSSGEAADA